jgi:hypothetical protein
MIPLNTNPSRRELLWFGALFLIFLGLVGVVLWWRFKLPDVARIIWLVAVVVTAAYYALPPLRRPLFVGWSALFFPIGWTVSFLVLVGVWWLVVTPIGVIMRLTGHDALQRRFDPSADSYWRAHRPPDDPARYFRQF